MLTIVMATFLFGNTVKPLIQSEIVRHGSAANLKPPLSMSLLSVSRYKVAITKHKDLEQTSSSLYSQNNIWNPAVDFSKYIEDNESIDNEVSEDGIIIEK